MNHSRGCPATLILFLLIFLGLSASAQSYIDATGLTLLRAAATNVNGAGIQVGQPEANVGT